MLVLIFFVLWFRKNFFYTGYKPPRYKPPPPVYKPTQNPLRICINPGLSNPEFTAGITVAWGLGSVSSLDNSFCNFRQVLL